MAKTAPDPAEAQLEEIIPEKEFKAFLSKASQGFFRLCNFLQASERETWSKSHYFSLVNEANELETFLDDFGARYNKAYSFFTELVASIRGFGLAAHSLRHLENRYSKYNTEGGPKEHEGFLGELREARHFLKDSLSKLVRELVSNARSLGIEVPSESLKNGQFADAPPKKHLPRNVDEEDLVNEEQKIAEVSSKFIRAVEMLGKVQVHQIQDHSERRSYIENHCTEEKARTYEAQVHNLQSKYDTYIKNTTTEKQDDRLPRLRGHISAALHLLEVVTYLVHFYERHENDIRSEKTKEQISKVIDKNEVLDKILNFGLYHADRILRRGKGLAEGLLPHYTNVQTLEMAVPEGRYFHARPASLIVSIVNHYGTPVEMEMNQNKCNAASIMQMMILAGSNPGVRKLVFRGDEHPLGDIKLLFEHDLGEEGMESLPQKLSYLKSQSAT